MVAVAQQGCHFFMRIVPVWRTKRNRKTLDLKPQDSVPQPYLRFHEPRLVALKNSALAWRQVVFGEQALIEEAYDRSSRIKAISWGPVGVGTRRGGTLE